MEQPNHSKLINNYEKIANEFGTRLAKGYINNYDVGNVYTEAQEWVQNLVDKGEIKSGFVREVYPKTDVAFEIGLCPVDTNLIYFLYTEWYPDGDISHSFGFSDLYIKN